jgi:hypothetical protein
VGKPSRDYLWCEVDAGPSVEKQLGHVEVLVVSCDVEGRETRLGITEGEKNLSYCDSLAPLSQNQARIVKKLIEPEDPTHKADLLFLTNGNICRRVQETHCGKLYSKAGHYLGVTSIPCLMAMAKPNHRLTGITSN